MASARAGGDIQDIFAQLDTLAHSAAVPVQQEARFRKAQLMLEGNVPGASESATAVIRDYPNHALVPYAHFWLARWWIEQELPGRALQEMRASLLHPRLTGELVDHILDIGPALVPEATEHDAVDWLLTAADIDLAGRDSWLRIAARRASMDSIAQHLHDGSVSPRILPDFSLYAGRTRLMNGDIEGVKKIAALLAQAMPNDPKIAQLESWASGEISPATIAVMLPLSGKYARYGEQALRGIRMALASLDFDQYITLRVEDTASDRNTAIQAYRKLASENVSIIIGPLLSDTTEAIVPYLKSTIPVISLTGRTDLAQRSDALFIHTLSPLAQVNVMALYAWQHEAKRIVVITDAAQQQSEAALFASTFTSLGGEVLQTLQLQQGQLDYRDQLKQLRFDTDDEELLAELDEDLNVLLPEMDVEIRMPVNFDAVYLALNGKQVALLAGQLAYAGISGVPLYGSSRWNDGHLLDDRGRYLSHARFATSNRSQHQHASAESKHFDFTHREAWGSGKASDLTRLSYDTMRIATVMTNQLGLEKHAILRELQDPEGFPAMTGHVQFDASGVGQKKLDIYSIQKGKIVPAG